MKNLIQFKYILTLLFCLGITGTAALASDGVVIKSTEYNVKANGEKVKTGTSIMYINDSMIRIKMESNGNSNSVIFNAQSKEMTIFLNNREYIVLGEQEIVKIKAQIKSMFAMMEKMQANMTEEQKKAIPKNLPGGGEKVTYTYKAEGSGTVNGWNSNKYAALENGKKAGTMHIASFGELGVSATDFSAMKKFMTYFQEQLADISNQFNGMASGGQMIGFGGNSPAFNNGLPVKVSVLEDGKISSETIIDSVEKKSLEDDLFKIPPGMTKKDIMGMMGGNR